MDVHIQWVCIYINLNDDCFVSEKHVEKLRDLSGEMINKLMAMVVDIDTLYHRIQQEDDSDTKQVIEYIQDVLEICKFYIFSGI